MARRTTKGRSASGHPLKGKTSSGGPKFLNGRKGGATQAGSRGGRKITKRTSHKRGY
jgi:hypothetical protein